MRHQQQTDHARPLWISARARSTEVPRSRVVLSLLHPAASARMMSLVRALASPFAITFPDHAHELAICPCTCRLGATRPMALSLAHMFGVRDRIEHEQGRSTPGVHRLWYSGPPGLPKQRRACPPSPPRAAAATDADRYTYQISLADSVIKAQTCCPMAPSCPCLGRTAAGTGPSGGHPLRKARKPPLRSVAAGRR